MAALALLTIPAAAVGPEMAAPGWIVDPAASTLGYAGVGNSESFEGSFSKWSAQINFDPAHLDQSLAKVTIDTGSASSGDPSRDDPLREGSWFNIGAFPNATFTTNGITSTGPNAYVADGTLTIKGVSKPVKLPFTLTIDGDTAKMKGEAQIDRTEWGLGEGSWQDKSVDPNVTVKVDITATRAS
ncbi:MAG: hypothetical protein BGO57_16695 [Sphingomonadales bacterium 63-6]|nr:MAG: hypothetical protein BGO57_16695 [Sphingomonadales bacterium 63-6]